MIEKYGLVGKLCHYSVGEGLALIREALRRGLPVTCEVTPHHLFFDGTGITEENRGRMQMNPPLRNPSDRKALLEALREGNARLPGNRSGRRHAGGKSRRGEMPFRPAAPRHVRSLCDLASRRTGL